MFSRAGKYTEERNMILSKKDQILNNQQKKFIIKSTSLANLSSSQKTKEEILFEKVQFFTTANKPILQTKKSNQKSMSDFNLNQEEDMHNLKASACFMSAPKQALPVINNPSVVLFKEKYPPPPCGYYSMNYKQVEQESPVRKWNITKSPSRKVFDKS